LPISETFIYGELLQLKRYEPHVFCEKRLNKAQMPFDRVTVDPSGYELKRRLRRRDFALLHARFGMAGVKLAPLRTKYNIPLVTSFHGCDAPGAKRMRKRPEKLLRLFAAGDCFTVPCAAMKAELLRYGCPEEKVIVHYSGIDLERFPFRERTPPERGPIRILYVGRMVEKKGADVLLHAFRLVRETYPNARLTMVGEGKLLPDMRRLAAKLRLAPYVEFTGALPHREVAKQLQSAHLFCLPSMQDREGSIEGIPNAIKEAMATGLPVVSTFHSGIPELIEDGSSGLLVPENDPVALAGKLTQLISRPDVWAPLGRNARARIETDFDRNVQTAKLEALFDRVIAAHAAVEAERRERPLFSVVIPTYNREKFIGRAIRSVLRQSCDDYEIIVVDDGSTDRTRRVVQSFGGRVRYIRQPNRGPSEARNTGIRSARGEFIAFLDSDDRFLPNKLEANRKFLEKHPECNFLYSWYYDVNRRRQKLRKGKQYKDLDQFRYHLYRRHFTIRTSTVVVHRSCFEKAGLFHPGYRYSQDWDMWLRLAAHYRGFCQQKALAVYRRHERKHLPSSKRHRRIRNTALKLYRWSEKELAGVSSGRKTFGASASAEAPNFGARLFGIRRGLRS